jgi:hypothetical protein
MEQATTSHHYAREKFHQAVHALATSPRSIQERLASAGEYLLRLNESDDLPLEHRREFNAVCQELAKGDGDIISTTRKLADEECSKLADRILSVYTELRGGI